MYMFSRFSANTHTHTHTHRVIYQGNGTGEKVSKEKCFQKRRFKKTTDRGRMMDRNWELLLYGFPLKLGQGVSERLYTKLIWHT